MQFNIPSLIIYIYIKCKMLHRNIMNTHTAYICFQIVLFEHADENMAGFLDNMVYGVCMCLILFEWVGFFLYSGLKYTWYYPLHL